MVLLVLSLDYEVFGNGAGEVVRDVVSPTRRLLDLCERCGAKMTIMLEVGEYWAFQQYEERLQRDLGYSPARIMKEQISEAIARGHDVQLHLHPQWIGAEYDRGVWHLRNSYWRLADLPGGLGNEEQVTSILGALHRGKRTLEDLLKPVRADYECACFRAGGFYAQPSRQIIRAMKKIGLKADSSVIKGFRKTEPFAVDYSHVPPGKAAWWTTDTDLTEEGAPGENILELSVSSRMEPYWKNFKMTKLQTALWRRKAERVGGGKDAAGKYISSLPSGRTVLKSLWRKHVSTFDFGKFSCRDMLQRIEELGEPQQQPVILVGHSKDFANDRPLEEFLTTLSRRGDVRFLSMSECLQEMLRGARISRPPQRAEAVSSEAERP